MAITVLTMLCIATLGVAHAQPRALRIGPTVRPVAIENPAALRRFTESLAGLRAGRRRQVRVAHYGDSNVAAGLWTGVTRQRLQHRFGDGGPGYLVPPPWGSMPHPRVSVRGGNEWSSRRHGAGNRHGPADGLWGLAGVAVEGRGASAALSIEVEAQADATVEIHALGRPGGGTFEVTVEGGEPIRVDTARRRVAPITTPVEVPTGLQTIRVRVTSWRPVRLLGVDVSEQRSGLIYDTLGINGQRGSAVSRWHRRVWGQQLRQRNPDLIVLGYGGNEALDVDLTIARYEEQLQRTLTDVRRAAPESSCLVVAPVAMCDRPRNAEVNAVQRRLASRHGCAFWDTAAVSGGADSLCGWIRHGLVSSDQLHLSEEGYALVGNVFADALISVGPQ